MVKEKIELTLQDESGQEYVAYPFVESEDVTLSNGMDIETMIAQDVSMPIVTHEETSFKVGIGDSDISNSIVDSSVANMTIKGQTYQNILPDPTLRNSMTDGKTMQKLNEGYESVNTVDGVCKSAILKGNTLVNLVPNKGENTIVGTGDRLIKYELPYILSKNKKYLLCCNIKTITTPSNTGQILFSLYSDDGNTTQLLSSTTSTGYLKTIFTTLDQDYSTQKLWVYIRINETTSATFDNIMLLEYQEGMENWDIPYFTGMQSIKMPVLTTTGKNLSPINDYETTVWEYAEGYQGFNKVLAKNILVNENKEYRLSFTKECEDGLPTNLGYILVQFSSIPVSSNIDDHNSVYVHCQNNEGKKYAHITMPNIGQGNEYVGKRVTLTNIQLEEGSVATSYEPYKTNILHTPEEVVLHSLPNGVCDTLNLMTGEYVKRVECITFQNQTGWQNAAGYPNLFYYNYDNIGNANIFVDSGVTPNLQCDKFPVVSYAAAQQATSGIKVTNRGKLGTHSIAIYNSNVSNIDELKAWLQENPFVIQYELATPVVKTVDLSSSGNWEKVVLDGSENWLMTNNTHFYTKLSNELSPNALLPIIDNPLFTPKDNSNSTANAVWYGGNVGDKNGNIVFNVLDKTLEQFKQYLSQNPITVWYQTTNHKDSTQVKQPIFFKDGHVQLSSGADNSLIPTLDYQAKTSNSYVMDLMKTNTRYTMKAKSASGTFTIDGTSYGAGTNGTFTTPSSMTNKLLVMSDTAHEEVMILEGDVTDKTIPYFKGIKSAFEDEDKIEVLSTGKNLFDGAFEKGIIDVNGNLGYTPTAIRTVNYISVKPNASYHINLLNLEPFESLRVVYVHEYDENFKVLGETQVNNRNIYTSKSATKFIKINTHNAHDLPVDSKMIVCENSTLDKQYEPYKSNNTKIPLLSPLRSLPNGVCDELIIDQMKKKATLIKRLDCITFDGSSDENWHSWGINNSVTHINSYHYVDGTNNTKNLKVKANPSWFTSRLGYGGGYTSNKTGASLNNSYFAFSIPKNLIGAGGGDTTTMCEKNARKWLSQNPVTVYYELATPIVTEIDLERFPYVYKDGHIFLNSEIAPVTEIKYSINQQHQIEASNQDIIRHQKEIDYLYKLIGEYVRVDYKNTLLSLNLELK